VNAPLLELRGVRVRAGGRTILEVAHLEIAAGSTTAVLGPNGAGKSTLLRVAGALLGPDEGQVLLDGAAATRTAMRSRTAAVLQRPLLRRGSVQRNAETALRFHGVARGEATDRAAAWLDRLGVGDLRRRGAHTLSGGEAQRVSLARALAVGPQLLLLDEPFANLDAATRGELLADLRDVLADTGTAALLVTHDRHEAAALADRIALLHGGVLRQEGGVADVLEHPADAACARVLGFENVLPATVAGVAGDLIAIRAEHCAVGPGGTGLAGTLRRVVPLGASVRVIAEIDGGHLVTASMPAPAPAWLDAATPGDPVTVQIADDRARSV
jgi:ABC-type nitrate/sulfonate/bicarbonate transport system ATPase subunit